jgi:hypothetical protein
MRRRLTLPKNRGSRRKPALKKGREPEPPTELITRAQWVARRTKVPYSPITDPTTGSRPETRKWSYRS